MTRIVKKVDCTVGNNIRTIRKLKRLTQENLADDIGVSRINIQNIEAGTRDIKAMKLFNISKVLGVDINQLFEGCK